MNSHSKSNYDSYFSQAFLREVFNNVSDGIAVYGVKNDGKDFILKDFNKAAEKIEKIKKKDSIGRSIKEIFPGVTKFGLYDVLKRVYETGKPERYPLTLYEDKRIKGWKENYVFKISSGEVVAIYKDLTRQKQVEEEFEIISERYKDLFESSLDGIYQSTIEGKYIDANNALVKMLGYDSKEELVAIDIPTQLYVFKEDRPNHKKRNRIFETKLRKKDGAVINVEISSRVIYKDDKPAFYEGIVRDITERKKIEEQLKFLSFHDKLTGLYNRAYFEEELKRLDTKRQLPLSFIMADVNGLKLTNDAFGHKEGDKLLCNCARIFEKCFRKEDIIARWGGDEFVMLLPKTPERETLNIKNRILKECLKTSAQKIPVSISMGVSTKNEPDKDINMIIIEAEELMYQNKLIENKKTFSSIIASLKRMLSEKGIETEEHIKRVKFFSIEIAKHMGLPESKAAELSLLAALHDIGKAAIPEEILLKKGKLSETEWKIIKTHPQTGYNIIRYSPNFAHIAEAILAHHECWDGSGYPRGIKGESIPLTSRILSVADAYVVMTNKRTYKNKMSVIDAIEELKRCAGKQFDPAVVENFLKIVQKSA